jgi:sugar transferase (PEP-CTERM/EpsH1 system associated)
MRILFLVHRLPYPPNKGDKIRSFWELQSLSARHEVDLFCFYDDPADQHYLKELSRYYRRCYAEGLSPLRSRGRALAAAALGRPFSLGFYYSPTMERRIQQALETQAYDLILVFSSQMAQYVASVSSLPRVLDMVDVDSLKWEQYAQHAVPPSSWLWKREGRNLARFEAQIVKNFSLTMLCTEGEANLLRGRCASPRIYSLPHPLDVTYYDPSLVAVPQEVAALQPYIIFTGSMDYLPNVDGVLQFYRNVFPTIRARLPQVRFVIAGRNPTRSVRRLATDPAVHVTGSVSDIRPYLRGATAAVVPLRIARGLQNKLIEAMAMGLPVAASRITVAALPESLWPLLIIEDDPQLLADKLVGLIRNGSAASPQALREGIAKEYGRARLEQEFESLLLRAQELHAERRQEDALDRKRESRALSAYAGTNWK